MRPQIKRKQRTIQISLSLKSTYLFDLCMFAASVFIVMVNFFLCISFDLQKERTKERRKEQFFSNRELLSTRKHWTINPSLAQAHHQHYRHIAFISFQLKISTPFRKLSTHTHIHTHTQTHTHRHTHTHTQRIHCIQQLFCFVFIQNITSNFYA